MFEISITPDWVIYLSWAIPVIALISMIIYSIKKGIRYVGYMIGITTIVTGISGALEVVLLTVLTSLNPILVTNNPHGIDKIENVESVTINVDEINKFIAKQIEVDNVSSNIPETISFTYIDKLSHSEIVEFIAIDDDTQIMGSFYFEEDIMVIVAIDENGYKNRMEAKIE